MGIWSMGVIFYNMLTGQVPFRAKDKYALMLQLAAGTLELDFPESFSPFFRKIIENCLQYDPLSRPSAEQLLADIAMPPALMSSSSGSLRSEDFANSSSGDLLMSLHEINDSKKDGTTSLTIFSSYES